MNQRLAHVFVLVRNYDEAQAGEEKRGVGRQGARRVGLFPHTNDC